MGVVVVTVGSFEAGYEESFDRPDMPVDVFTAKGLLHNGLVGAMFGAVVVAMDIE